MVPGLLALSLKVGLDIVGGGEVPIGIGGVYGICTQHFCFGLGEALGQLYRLLEPCALVEVVKGQVFDEADAVYLQFVDLRPEYDRFDLLSPFDGTYIWSVKAYDTALWSGPFVELP